MTAELEHNPNEPQAINRLPFRPLALSFPERANELLQNLQHSDKLYAQDDSRIVSKVAVDPPQGEYSDIDYCVFDKKNGFPNYRARYAANGELVEAVVWKYTNAYADNEELLPDTKNVSIASYVHNYGESSQGNVPLQEYHLDLRTLRYHVTKTRPENRTPKAEIQQTMTAIDTEIKSFSQKTNSASSPHS